MLFHEPAFLFVFLPIVWLIYRALAAGGAYRSALGWLVVASLVFYGYWNPPYVALLLASMAMNYAIGRMVCPHDGLAAPGGRRAALWGGLAWNLGLLGYFKYANFFVETMNAVLGASFQFTHVILPLAISFFTFTQIAYLMDAARGEVRGCGPLDYAFFVTFFPHLIAGPIVQHHEILPQVRAGAGRRFALEHLVVGGSMFVVGLFKKLVLADGCAGPADAVFGLVAKGETVDLATAWLGVLAYAFQLYFDFSGYSDMAVGLSWGFGFRLPINFDSPYRAPNIVEFWRRWHISLSRFLRTHVYIPLGGNRHGPFLRYRNLLVTMLLGGLWHGAGWNFLIWGGLHGAYLIIAHGFRAWRPTAVDSRGSSPGRLAAWALTFLAVTVAWVFFRAPDLPSAMRLLYAMGGVDGGAGAGMVSGGMVAWIAVVGAIALLAPNAQRYFAAYQPALESLAPARVSWRPSWGHGLLLGAMVFLLVRRAFSLQQTSFLYFNF